jgi:hypothetical protein
MFEILYGKYLFDVNVFNFLCACPTVDIFSITDSGRVGWQIPFETKKWDYSKTAEKENLKLQLLRKKYMHVTQNSFSQ